MRGPGSRAATVMPTVMPNGRPPRSRPVGLSHGASALCAAGTACIAIAVLTGATAVVILLAVGTVAIAWGVVSGWWALRGVCADAVTTASLTVAGDELQWHVRLTGTHPVHVRLSPGGACGTGAVAEGWVAPDRAALDGIAPRRGVYHEVNVALSSAGRAGLVWWRRTQRITIGDLIVAASAAGDSAPVTRANDDRDGSHPHGMRSGRDEVDGVRQWRDGDELTSVHWPSTMRAGEFVVRQRLRERDDRWVVQAHTGTTDPAAEAGRVRTACEHGLAAGARVAVQVNGGEPQQLADEEAVLRWSAHFDPNDSPPPALPWWKRPFWQSPEPERALAGSARWLLAFASAVAALMVLQPLGYDAARIALVVLAIIVGAWVSGGGRPRVIDSLRQLLSLVVGIGVGALLIDMNAIDSVAASLRYLLPQVLVTLVVMQGFECTDRRGARVTLACAAVLTAYAAGIRVDARLTPWLFAAITAMAIASPAIARTRRPTGGRQQRSVRQHTRTTIRLGARRAAAIIVSVGAVFAILAVVPVPRGPAQLTLPTWLSNYRPTNSRGQLATSDGSPLLGGIGNNRTRGASNSSGASGYPGFSNSMDTALRGDLGDEVVLRVRSPEPDFWRGQTFNEFDGRTWYVDKGTADVGERTSGPDHDLKLTSGDTSGDTTDELIQTFYVETDLNNLVFAAYRPTRVLLDAPLWQRPDGALRAGAVLTKGSAYTVVSLRNHVTAAALRAAGDLTSLTANPHYLQLPESTTERTRSLAQQIANGQPTTYDVILAIEAWLSTHVTYDLNAPVPPSGADAVDDFLFESHSGFCEQIATATAIMLRSLGIPARIATGYVPSSRDEVAGVWISRASDAHAWVEVNFPRLGWVPFDPTADVPLSGDSARNTIGLQLLRSLGQVVGDHIAAVLLTASAAAIALAVVRLVRRWRHRRRRGRWGLLQDRFTAAALARGAPSTASNALLADAFADDDAVTLATELDASAFSVTWTDDDDRYARAEAALHTLTRR